MKLIVGISGASGVIYGVKFLEALNSKNIETHLVITPLAEKVLEQETNFNKQPRETPLRKVHLENMLRLANEGATILPAMPGFYYNPKTLDDAINHIVGKALDILKIDHNLYQRWSKEKKIKD